MTAVAPDGAVPRAESWRHDAFVAAATFMAGLFGYGFSLVLSHALGPSGFGALSALLAVAILAAVPGAALQAGIAGRISAAPQSRDDGVMLRQSVVVAVVVGAAVMAFAPLLRMTLGVRSWADLTWLAVLMIPTTLAYGCLGVLQGRRRFVAFGWLLIGVQAAKLAGGALAAATRTGIGGALAGTAVLTLALVAGVCVQLMRAGAPRRNRARIPLALAGNGMAMLGVLLLSNLDLILARHYLTSHQAGLYAAGNLVTKVAFWGPSFVSTVAYPRLTRADERQPALRRATLVLSGFGLITTLAALIGAPLIRVFVGAAYRPVEPIAWLFALQGAALAAVLLAVYAGLAVHSHRFGVLVWVVAAAEATAVAVVWHGSIRQILTVVLCGSAALIVAAVRRPRSARAVRSAELAHST